CSPTVSCSPHAPGTADTARAPGQRLAPATGFLPVTRPVPSPERPARGTGCRARGEFRRAHGAGNRHDGRVRSAWPRRVVPGTFTTGWSTSVVLDVLVVETLVRITDHVVLLSTPPQAEPPGGPLWPAVHCAEAASVR